MEATVGMQGLLPRIAIPRPASVQTGPVTLNNIHVNESVVGVINTGSIKQLDLAMDNIRKQGAADVADAVQRLSQAVLDASDLDPSQKKDAVEHLTFVAEQAALPKEQRQSAVGKAVVGGLERLLNASASITSLWAQLAPYIEPLFK
jgi:hypothetical protein